MSFRSGLLLILAFAAAAAGPGHAQERIGRVKSAPQDYRDRQIQLVGEVVEIRALSPRSERGVYRLVDETDPVGLLVRTGRLPGSGGPFRVRARLSPELLLGGVLLVDEIDRTLARSNMLPLALGIGALGLLACLVLAGMYIRARRAERRLRLGPPMWLIPSAVEEPKPTDGEAQESTPLHFNYRLHYIEQERSTVLDRQKQRLLLAAAGTAVVAATGAGWFAVLRQEDAARPAFVLLSTNPVPVGTDSARADTVRAPVTRPRPDDTLRVAVAAPVAPPPPPQVPASRDTTRRSPAPQAPPPAARTAPIRRDTTPSRREPQPQPVRAEPQPVRRDTVPFRQDTARAGTQVVVVSVPRDTPRTVTQPAVTSPPPPPPVTPPPRGDTAAATAAPARPDPAALRRAAETELSTGMLRFAGALDARQLATVAAMYPGAGDGRREKFLGFLRQYTPSATLRGSEPPTLTETTAQTSFTIGFRWRAEFGVERRKDVRFGATARRSGTGWAFETVRLLEAFP